MLKEYEARMQKSVDYLVGELAAIRADGPTPPYSTR